MSKLKIYLLKWYEEEKYIKRLKRGYRLWKFHIPNSLFFIWENFYVFLIYFKKCIPYLYNLYKIIQFHFYNLYNSWLYFLNWIDFLFTLNLDYRRTAFLFIIIIFFMIRC